MIEFRKSLLPRMLAIMTAFSSSDDDEECAYLWVTFLWLASKNFLKSEESPNREKLLEHRLKAVVLGLIEMTVSLLLMTAHLTDHYGWLVCLVTFAFFALVTMFQEVLGLAACVFILTYSL